MAPIVFALAFTAHAQTNKYTPKAEDFRIVNGKLYNAELSTNFVTLNEDRKIQGVMFYLKVVDPHQAGTVMQSCTWSVKGGERRGTFILVKNLPEQNRVTTGQDFERRIRVMPNGTHQWRSTKGVLTINAYDYGLPNVAAK